ncbi:glutamate 5-kinase [Peniophora sp. CONT]|nr:glutamate 5-kinase [Peniophora sp. CONT]
MARPSTVVIKLGSSSIVHEKTHHPLLSTLSSVVELVADLRAQGHKVVLVSSGAIAVGLQRMEMPSRPKSLQGKQALAAIGQGRLIALWDNLFGQLGQPIAQILLTRGDISDRTRYLNAVNTFKELLNLGVVPIVNENDTISVSEIKFGDNDTLSAITATMVHADYLFLLTDVDGLYTSNPRKDPNAKMIEVVSSVAGIRKEVSTATLGSSLGTGGMETKLIAAEIATAAGVMTVICSSRNPQSITDIIAYHVATSPQSSSGTSTPDESDASTVVTPSELVRPPHTAFTPSPTPLRDLKSWTSHTLHPSGSVVIDAGAHHVLSRRESGGRLLSAGVLAVRGAFAAGQAVRILVRRGPGSHAGQTAEEARAAYFAGLEGTRPTTPTLKPVASISSSIVSLATLERNEHERQMPAVPEEDTVLMPHTGEEEAQEEWETEEVGRGLANYNSAQIARVKGLRSSYMAQLLGYADSEYVVENVTIRVPP